MSNLMRIPFSTVGICPREVSEEIEMAVSRVLKSGWYVLGEEVVRFENAFAEYLGVDHIVAVANGTDAIELALRANDVGQGDEVITVSHTAMPTVVAIERAGATPVLVDIDPNTYLMDVEQVEGAITERTKAIVPVHLYGHPVPMDRLGELAAKHGLLLLEDCAQAHGASLNGKAVGTFGHVAAFSFYPTKNLGAYGDAGAIATNDTSLAERLRRMRNYGQEAAYRFVERGVNSRMDDIQAAILSVKLKYLETDNEARRRLAKRYDEGLRGVVLPVEEQGARHVYHLYVIRHPRRDALQAYLADHGVQTLIHYPVPIHQQLSHLDLGYATDALPVTCASADTILSLPLYPRLKDVEQDRVVELIDRFSVA